jgi:hypothetical protein
MTRSRYSENESLIRLLKVMEGKQLTSDTPNVIPGEVLSTNESLSDMAELWEGSLPDETLHIPYAGLPFASVVEANAGTSNVVLLSPASHSWAHEYGGIYISTGSSLQAFTANTWTKITGAFQFYMQNSGAEINCDWNDDRIIINEIGTYFISWNLSLYTDGSAYTTIDAAPSVSGTVDITARNRSQWVVTGSYVAFGGGAHIDVPNSGFYVDLRLRASASISITPFAGQLMVQKMVG